jgi:hypothetical protein
VLESTLITVAVSVNPPSGELLAIEKCKVNAVLLNMAVNGLCLRHQSHLDDNRLGAKHAAEKQIHHTTKGQ